MNPEKNLFLINGIDKTSEVTALQVAGDRVEITYAGDKRYSYGRHKIVWHQDPLLIPPGQALIFVDGQQVEGIRQAQVFADHVRVYTASGYRTFPASRVGIVRSGLTEPRSQRCFEYLKGVAHSRSLPDEGGDFRGERHERREEQGFLSRQYDEMGIVREDCLLTAFLRGELPPAPPSASPPAVYPFGCNLSQKTATEKALQYPLSVIEGPPGTGKTQTILNIIANIVMSGKSVAVTSNNNSATADVLEELQKNGVECIAAPLGNKKNKEKFIETQGDVPDLSAWGMEEQEETQVRAESRKLLAALDTMLEKKNALSALERELEAVEQESGRLTRYFSEFYATAPCLKTFRKLDAQKALDLWRLCEDYVSRDKTFGLWARIRNFFRFGLVDKAFYSLPTEKMILTCQIHFYEQKLLELRGKITELSHALSSFGFDEKMREYAEASMKLFRAYLYGRYGANKRKKYKFEDLLKNAESFLKEYPVVLSATHALRYSLPGKIVYDYVIIDEASQVDLVTGALALSCAKKAVIVGDSKQLPNVIREQDRNALDAIFQEFALPEAYRYSTHSLLRSVLELFPELPATQLREYDPCRPNTG